MNAKNVTPKVIFVLLLLRCVQLVFVIFALKSRYSNIVRIRRFVLFVAYGSECRARLSCNATETLLIWQFSCLVTESAVCLHEIPLSSCSRAFLRFSYTLCLNCI